VNEPPPVSHQDKLHAEALNNVVPGIDKASGQAYFYNKKTRKSVWSFADIVKEMGLDHHGKGC
jgi:hypothetical protein